MRDETRPEVKGDMSTDSIGLEMTGDDRAGIHTGRHDNKPERGKRDGVDREKMEEIRSGNEESVKTQLTGLYALIIVS